MSSRSADVVVVGAGLIGAAAAVALAHTGYEVVLVDQRPALAAATINDTFDTRVVALSPASKTLLERLEVWQTIPSSRIQMYSEMFVWDAISTGSVRFSAAEYGALALGYIVENSRLEAALQARCAALGVSVYRQTTPVALDSSATGQHILHLADGRQLTMPLLVGADGSDSWVRNHCGIAVRGQGYGQLGIVCNVAAEQSHQATAWQRFLPGGPLALLPLANGEVSVVWSVPTQQAQNLLALAAQEFEHALTDAFAYRLGMLQLRSARAGFALRWQQAERYVAERVVLLGDAAHTVHPLAGQGANLGLQDVAALLENLMLSSGNNRAIALRNYERARRGEIAVMQQALTALNQLFKPEQAWLTRLRGVGLAIVDHCIPVKRYLMREAMGLGIAAPGLDWAQQNKPVVR